MKLYDGTVSAFYTVRGMNLPEQTARRLEALGLVNGTTFALVNKKKSALVVNIRGARFALGKKIAENIEVAQA